jgi:methylated-DNA-[protein]-cysteine S-methyltransferase
MLSIDELHAQILNSPFGQLHAAWSPRGLWSITFLEETPAESLNLSFESEKTILWQQHQKLEREMEHYFFKGRISWELDSLDWRGISSFQRRALEACYAIPSGTTCTYSALAARIGNPQAARAIGGAMAKNRWPLLIPCHRVVGSDGRLTGYSGRGGIDTKRRLLEMERELVSAEHA